MIKVIELLAESNKSWEDATKQAVADASKSVRNIKSVYVKEQNCVVENNKITQFRVTVKITFAIDKK